MNTKEIWEIVDRHTFLVKLAEAMVIFPHIPLIAEEYKVEQNSNKLMLRKGRYEWEFSDIGVFRFRDITCGPWTQWRSCERS